LIIPTTGRFTLPPGDLLFGAVLLRPERKVMKKDYLQLAAIILCLLFFMLLCLPRSEDTFVRFGKAYAQYREMQEVALWSH